jgi:hypothetical protein
MYFKRLSIVGTVLLLLTFLDHELAYGQWTAPYSNSWINYSKPYVKIGIAKKGIHKIPFSSLPQGFSVAAPEKLQLWRRGKQVSIISTANNEILFYAVPNDGGSDSLLYRPMKSRMNPYFSMYSDESSYFLTNGDIAGARAKVVTQAVDNKIEVVPAHNELVTANFQTDYSLSTQNPVRPDFFNSFFEIGASRTGKVQVTGTVMTNAFTLQDLSGGADKASIKMLIHGRSNNARKIEIYVGKNAQSLRLVYTLPNNGFEGTEFSFNLKPEDVDESKKGIFTLKTLATERSERFSLAYYSVGYPQAFNMAGAKSKEFTLAAGSVTWNRLQIKGAPVNPAILDISDPDIPVFINGLPENLMVPRSAGKVTTLLASNEVTTIAPAKISLLNLKAIAAKEPNYIIITTEGLTEGATKYAEYRASPTGGGFKPLIVKINDIYNQFNYGEPSPLAIKKFMAYLLNEGGKEKYLFLIGKSITHNERMKRELPDEVPTIGYPGSDMLLVEGLAGAAMDLPAIPVGRLAAISNQHIYDYLQKVKDYEQNVIGEYGWRKNILHLNGGKNTGEINQLKDLLGDLVPSVVNGVIGGRVTPFVKQQPIAEVESVNITSDVNKGVGLITYFGHGSPIVTDLDMGYITDVARGYDNKMKYPMMYFNGCGVGNIFSNRYNPDPNAVSDRITLSLDWLLAPNRGSVAVIANSFESFVSPAFKYLQQLYTNMFVDPATVNLSVGKIQIAVANAIISNSRDKYSVANVHQSLLQGDPALKLITVDKPDYAMDPDESITLYSESASKTFEASDSITVSVIMSNQGRFVSNQSVPVQVTYLGKSGNIISSKLLKSFPYGDTVTVSFVNKKDIQKVQVHIDPTHTLSELDTRNNIAELEVDWDFIKSKNIFSSANNKDIIAPILSVRFDDRPLKDGESIAANPVISFKLQDDRQLFPDTALIDIFLKRCGDNSCDFVKLAYSKLDVELDSVDNYTFQLNLLTKDLGTGSYELLATVKDRAGNASVQPYRISFKIGGDVIEGPKLVVSPNPASAYARFELYAGNSMKLKSIRYLIYNQAGVVMEDKEMTQPKWPLTSEWYWMSGSLPSGLYAYKVILTDVDGKSTELRTGKLAIVK